MNIESFLESTYLKTALQANISEAENTILVENLIDEAIQFGFKLVMIRPEHIALANKKIAKANSKILVGTVIDFPNGNASLEEKLVQAQAAINADVDELDFVLNYDAFKNEKRKEVKNEIIQCVAICIANKKTIKFIIETAALSTMQIIQISALIKNTVIANFKEEDFSNIFVKSSTGFYTTKNNLPNGATKEGITLMIENAFPLSVKASGGIKSYDDALEMIRLGVKRIGTSSARNIVENSISNEDY